MLFIVSLFCFVLFCSVVEVIMGNYSSKDGTDEGHTPIGNDITIPQTRNTRQQYMDHMQGMANDPSISTYGADNEIEKTVPTVFKWEHGGRHVYITGTFNNWERQIPMHRSGNDFTYVHNLKRGKHAFKYIVDDEWRFAPDQPTIADIEGRINNFIDVSDFTPYTGDDNFFEKSKDRKIPDEEFHTTIPDLDDYTKE